VALKPPKPESYPRWIWSFIGVGLAGVALTVASAWRADSAQSRLTGQITSIQIEQARTNGELSGIQSVMENLSKAGIPGLREFARSIISSLQTGMQHNAKETKLTNKQLCDRASALAQQIRTFESTYETNEEAIDSQGFAAMSGKTRDEMVAAAQKQQQDRMMRESRHDSEFDTQLSDAKYLHDKIIEQLTPDQRDELAKNNGQAEVSVTFARTVGARDEYLVAAYLDQLAKAVCPQ
jgi:hypothetical protein